MPPMSRSSKSVLLAIVGAGAIAFSSVSRADDPIRCGSSLVTREASVEELVQKCGEPDSKTVTEEDVRAANAGGGSHKVGTTMKEVWTYDRGSRAFDMVVTIVDGKIKSIVSKP